MFLNYILFAWIIISTSIATISNYPFRKWIKILFGDKNLFLRLIDVPAFLFLSPGILFNYFIFYTIRLAVAIYQLKKLENEKGGLYD